MASRKDSPPEGVSRRGFMRGVGLGGGALSAGVLESEAAAAQAPAAKSAGPGAAPITLEVNGKPLQLTVEPCVTLLDALRDHLGLTGAKRVCDRGSCGACTVLMAGKAVYSCSILAIDAQGKPIETIESLNAGGKTHPLITAFVANDGQQCGFCTPGFVMAAREFVQRNPNPTYQQVEAGLGGNLCRCGTYVGVRKAVLQAAGEMKRGGNA